MMPNSLNVLQNRNATSKTLAFVPEFSRFLRGEEFSWIRKSFNCPKYVRMESRHLGDSPQAIDCRV